MPLIQNIIAKYREKKSMMREAENEDRVSHLVEQRKKNCNERELERFYEEERQKQIKIDLEAFRKKRAAEINKNVFIGNKNIFKGHKSVLDDNKKMFSPKYNNMGFMGGGKI